ncbi:MAG TPA: hypothetical protein VKK31_13170 [Thermoanaerobaculia bacterium]|nr:hypothetical protein [Thermoanaerobaculia bacterium]
MSRSIVRRLTAAITLVTVLCFALPAVAAPARAHSPRAAAVLDISIFDQIVSWLGSLWPGQEPKPQSVREKTGIIGGTTDSSHSMPGDPDRGAMIDPNGVR